MHSTWIRQNQSKDSSLALHCHKPEKLPRTEYIFCQRLHSSETFTIMFSCNGFDIPENTFPLLTCGIRGAKRKNMPRLLFYDKVYNFEIDVTCLMC